MITGLFVIDHNASSLRVNRSASYNLMHLYPERGVGTVVMGNSTSYDVDGVTDAVAQPWLRQPS
ncbi:MAG: hypothetical protein E6G60_01090 [Actinobacteria bacterium]|nr:MAG: hypothetical protein E6G60_01090 [Actinomycetota bacterium]